MTQHPTDTPPFTPLVPQDAVTEEFETVEGEVVWHQPVATGPWHAKHERPGEWHTHPPDHLAFEHSPPAEVQPGVQHDEEPEAIPLSLLPHPWEVPFDAHAGEPVLPDRAPRHPGRWIALAAVLTFLLLGGGAAALFALLRNADSGRGAADPVTAVDRFMTAVYTQQDAKAAADLVCREARDMTKLQNRVDQIKGYATEYPAPVFSWGEPSVSGQGKDRATVAVQLVMSTDDERSTQQRLTFTVIRKTAWLVCDVTG
ncbi:hypothetical protein [Actinoplanes sp. N902-109]|uniref:Rv0361 family membrane protein n=1 Tax=Actinoplanes sp. (strain N902-109) TaxID=649831 RepID=UPI0003293EDD|nr:hypothetical protein [Actinoplanes sp. N902-109]AGL21420.1 hypothetical protein L083_7910 [Actinoplanes sp. N902-109]